MIEYRWMPALVASTLAGPAPGTGTLEEVAYPPFSAGAALVRAMELLAQASGETVFAVDSALGESSSVHGVERAVVTLRLSVFGLDEAGAEKAFDALGQRIAARPWSGEEEGPEYSRYELVFHHASSSRRWTPGQEGRELGSERTSMGLLSLTIDATELNRAPVVAEEAKGREASQNVESFIRASSAQSTVKVGQVDIALRTHEREDGGREHIWEIEPYGKRFTRGQIGNLIYVLDTQGPQNARVTRIELHRIPEANGADLWTFALEYTQRDS